MAEVTGRTAISIDELVGGTITSGEVRGGRLILKTRAGTEINAGPTNQGVGTRWWVAGTYNVGQCVGYAGILWECTASTATVGVPPALNMAQWRPVTGIDPHAWAGAEWTFDGSSVGQYWGTFWHADVSTVTYTQLAAETERGRQSLKIALSATGNQRFFAWDENIVQGGETIICQIRAKLLSGQATIDAPGMQSITGEPGPFAETAVWVDTLEGPQNLIAGGWNTYTFHIKTVDDLPRMKVSINVDGVDASGSSSVALQWVRMYRSTSTGKNLRADGVPSGTILEWDADLSSSSVPGGYLLADGRAVSRSIYPDLFAKIGTKYGAGDGSTTFNLPNRLGGGATIVTDIGPKFTPYAGSGRTNSTSWEDPVAFKDEEGFVTLYGLLYTNDGAVANDRVLTLPPGYRPSKRLIFPIQHAATVSSVTVNPDGTVIARATVSAATHFALSNIRFFAAGEAMYKEAITNYATGFSAYSDASYGPLEIERDRYGRCFVSGVVAGSTASALAFTPPNTNGFYNPAVPTQLHFLQVTQAGYTGFNYVTTSRSFRTRTTSPGTWTAVAFTFVDTMNTMQKLTPSILNGTEYSAAYENVLYRTPTGTIMTNGLYKPTATTAGAAWGLGPLTSPFQAQIWASMQAAEVFWRCEIHPADYGGLHSVQQNGGANLSWESMDSMVWATQHHKELMAGRTTKPSIIKI